MKINALFLKLLLNSGLLCIAAAHLIKSIPAKKVEKLDYHLPNNVVPLHYNIRLSLYDNSEISTVQGESNITIEVRRTTSKISLHTVQISILDVILIDKTDEYHRSLEYSYNSNTNIVAFDFGYMIPQGFYTLHIKYVSYLFDEEDGAFKTTYTNKYKRKM
jgi:hypothetical protein